MSLPLAIIVEDDPKLGMIYELTLRQAGYETFWDTNGDQVMRKLPTVEPALIILDMHLPYATGAEILEQIRADGRWPHVPIIVATADLFAANALQGKAQYVLAKPVSVARLLEVIHRLQEEKTSQAD